MEFLLQWADDLDDALSALGHMAPRVTGAIIGLVMLVASTLALVLLPAGPALVVIATLLCLSMGGMLYVRHRLRSARRAALQRQGHSLRR